MPHAPYFLVAFDLPLPGRLFPDWQSFHSCSGRANATINIKIPRTLCVVCSRSAIIRIRGTTITLFENIIGFTVIFRLVLFHAFFFVQIIIDSGLTTHQGRYVYKMVNFSLITLVLCAVVSTKVHDPFADKTSPKPSKQVNMPKCRHGSHALDSSLINKA